MKSIQLYKIIQEKKIHQMKQGPWCGHSIEQL